MYEVPETVERYTLYPMTLEDVLPAQLSPTEWPVLLMPAPLTAIDGGVFVALLTTVTVPANVPVAFGANTMCIVVLCPAASVAPLVPLVTL